MAGLQAGNTAERVRALAPQVDNRDGEVEEVKNPRSPKIRKNSKGPSEPVSGPIVDSKPWDRGPRRNSTSKRSRLNLWQQEGRTSPEPIQEQQQQQQQEDKEPTAKGTDPRGGLQGPMA